MEKRIAFWPILFVCLFAFLSCLDVTENPSSLVLTLPKSERSAITTDKIDLYEITILGTQTKHFESRTAKPGESVEFAELEADEYEVSLTAFVGELKVAAGTAFATVKDDETTEVQIVMKWLEKGEDPEKDGEPEEPVEPETPVEPEEPVSVEGTPYVEYSFDVSAKKLSAQTKGSVDCIELSSSGPTAWEDGKFYFASGNITIDDRISIADDATVYLILADDATLNVQGITMDSSTKNLVIYGQSKGTGVLNAESSYSGIGGASGSGAGNITIHGGTVNATGKDGSAGIGATGNNGAFDGTLTLYNGTVTATGNGWGAGIGGTRNSWGTSGTVVVYGGSLTATGGTQGAGIGGGEGKPGGTLKVYGGYVKGIGGAGGPFTNNGYDGSPAGIGGGGSYDYNGEQNSNGGTVEIYGGTLEAYGLRGIGSGGAYGYNSEGTLTIEDGLTYEIIAGDTEESAAATTLSSYEADRKSYVKITVR